MRAIIIRGWWMYLLMLLGLSSTYGQPTYHNELIFDPAVQSHGHVHASCIVECPNGDLLAVWYENGPKLPSFEL